MPFLFRLLSSAFILSMSWISITAADVQNRLTGAELSALKGAAKAASQNGDTILSEAISTVVKKVRGYVAGCSRNVLGETGTIPDELQSATLNLIRDYLFNRLPAMKDLNDELRQNETKAALAELRDASACKIAIVPPESPAATQAAGPGITLVGTRTRVVTREKTRGLL